MGRFSIPEFVSPFARDLIKSMLTTDPISRIKMKDVINHKWFQLIKPHMDNSAYISSLLVNFLCIPKFRILFLQKLHF